MDTEWPSDVALFQPYETHQALLYEYSDCLSVRTFLKMAGVKFNLESKSNAEFMSPSGRVPFIKCGNMVIAEMEPIVDLVNKKGFQLTDHLEDAQISEMTACMALVRQVLWNAEIYVCWNHEPTIQEVTKMRYGSVFPWPLNSILPWLKQRDMQEHLRTFGWLSKTLNRVLEDVNEACKVLSVKLGEDDFFFGSSPTELDALVFGHLYTILTTEFPDIDLAAIVKRYNNLIDFCKRIENHYYMSSVKKK